MANVGQAVLTIGGTLVGSFFGVPQLGYLLGSLAGQALFPTQLPTVKGPQLEDAKFQTSALGAAVPWVWGTFILAGQVIWRSPFLERKIKEKSGGKGGPEQTSIHYEYRVNVAIGLCGRPPTRTAAIAGIRRIWADTKLIYDASLVSSFDPTAVDPDNIFSGLISEVWGNLAASNVTAANMEVYLGDETQTADSTIETWEGVGNVPAYRGLAYIVLRDFELADYGNRIPNFRVEVFTDGVFGEFEAGLYSNDVLYPWRFQSDADTYDPRNPDNLHIYGYTEAGGGVAATFDDAMAALNASHDHPDQPFICGEVPQQGDSQYIHGWSTSFTPNWIGPCDAGSANLPILDYVRVHMTLNILREPFDYCLSDVGGTDCAAFWSFLGGKGNVKYVSDGQLSGYWVATDVSGSASSYFNGASAFSSDLNVELNCNVLGETSWIWRFQSHELGVERSLVPRDPCDGELAIPGAPGFCATADGIVMPSITWTRTVGTWHALRSYATSFNVVTAYPLNPIRPSTHAQYNDQAFWEAAYADAVAAGDIEAGLVYGVDYPETQAYGYVGTFGGDSADPNAVPLSSIVADICEGCGLQAYDVSDLTTTLVNGYALTSPMTGKAGIDPLRPFGYFDAVESEFEYKFVQRGHDSVETIDTEDLAARLHNDERPSSVTVVRAQDQELPRLVRGHFIDLARDGDPGQAEQQRQTVNSVNTADLMVPAVMSQERGQAMVDTVLFERWIARNSYQFSLPIKYVALEPSDCVILPVDGQNERMRITGVDMRAMAVLEVTAVRDDATIYGGTEIVGDFDTAQNIPVGGVPSPTELILLELPAIRAQDNDCGYYAATRGLLPGWPGAILYRATSVSGTFRQVAWTSVAATIGIVTESAAPDTGGNSGTGTSLITGGVDQTGTLRVHLYSGTFESVSEADMLAGENLLAVGTEGDWELIRFQIATQDTDGDWDLSSLVRAQYGTTRRTFQADDIVVLMTGPGIMRIDESSTVNGIERVLRAVTSGTSLEDAENHYITTTCLSATTANDAETQDLSAVLSQSLTEAPLAPSCGDTYIIASGSPEPDTSDAWLGHAGEIAQWNCETLSWTFIDPITGRPILVLDEDLFVYWDSTTWQYQSGGSMSPLTTKGDLIVHDGAADVRFPVGPDGTVPVADSTADEGISWRPLVEERLLYASAVVPAGNTVGNNNVETTFASAYSLPAGSFAPGAVLAINAAGVYSTHSTPPTLRIRVKVGGITVLDTTAFTTTASMTNRGWTLEARIHCHTAGVSGAHEGQGEAKFGTSATAAVVSMLANTATIALDTTTAQAIEITALWGTTNAANTLTLRQLSVYLATVQSVGSDPYFSNVVLLVGFDGADAATAAVDESAYARALTFNGNAQLDTAAAVFGSASSLLLDGTGDYVTAANSTDLSVSTGNFTIEAWVRRNANGVLHTISNKRSASSAQEHSLSVSVSNVLSFSMFFSGSSVVSLTSTNTLTADGNWHHVAATRQGTTVYLFLDGNLEASGAQSGNPSTNTSVLNIGRDGFNTSRDWDGWIDEYRFTKGICRYSASFTPPTDVFPRT